MKYINKYQLNKELPLYPKGSIVFHEYDELPSKFNDGTYLTDGEWYYISSPTDTKTGEFYKVNCPPYVGGVIKRAIEDYNVNQDDWVTVLS